MQLQCNISWIVLNYIVLFLGSSMKSILILNILLGFTYSDLGPCHPVIPVHVDICRWPIQMYINFYTDNLGQTCSWVNRYLNYTYDGQIQIAEQYLRFVYGEPTITAVYAQYVDKGHYEYIGVRNGKFVSLHVYFLLFDPPNLDIHYVCTSDPDFKNGKGTGSVYIESIYPDGPEEDQATINRVLTLSGFDPSELIRINNKCNCSIIPDHFGTGKCPNMNNKGSNSTNTKIWDEC
ncbi:uncharacterized protein LOC124372806 isoform X1 [Homalodisca vitripennis]|uniref:uncharacterized protein LOC124372806 isoform X1 n=1 Tax=Homalodisca vitripennis TaxID=197043 RepID=UPI001EECD13D|nr:uncharacterized protein LOC124372806 isoform X1 [Homalodisca vitripennis]